MSASERPFRPPFCPSPECPFHHQTDGWRFKRIGFFRRHRSPRIVQRYLCLHCRRSFSTQTFSVTYWLRRPDLLEIVFRRVLSCSSYRQIALELGVSPSTTARLTERLGRHCLLFQELYRSRAKLEEPLVFDGFESFEYSQYHPFHFNVAVGMKSQFFYAFTDAELRRKGAMTEYQKHRREELERRYGRPDPKAIEKEIAELLRLIPMGPTVVLHSDDHRAYPRALRRIPGVSFTHRVTSSKERRDSRNPLFAVNWLDLLIRHGSSNHKRETIAFSKLRQNAAAKLSILQVWRNFIRPLTMKGKEAPPAVALGLVNKALTVAEVLRERLFPSRIRLPDRLAIYYRRETKTRMIPNSAVHCLRYAY
jgi:transposase-like protein